MIPQNSMVFASHPTISSVTVAVVAKNCCKIIFNDMGLITGVILTAATVTIMFLSNNYEKPRLLLQGSSYYGVVTITEIMA